VEVKILIHELPPTYLFLCLFFKNKIGGSMYEVVKRFEFTDENGEEIILSEGQIIPDKYIQMFGPEITNNLVNEGYLKSIQVQKEIDEKTKEEIKRLEPSNKLREAAEKAKEEIETFNKKIESTEFQLSLQMKIIEKLKEGMTDEEIIEEVMNSEIIEDYMRENYIVQKRLTEYLLETIENINEIVKKGKKFNSIKPQWDIPKKNELDKVINEIVFNPEKKEEIRDIITEIILEVYNTIFTSNIIYVYDENEGIYKPIEENWLKSISQYIADKLNVRINETDRNEIINNIKAKVYISDIKTNDEISNLIPFKNGYYNIKENKFYNYHPAKIFFSKLNTNYNENVKEPTTFLKFLDDITEHDEIKKNLILDMITYCLYRGNPHEQMFVLIGSGANGKSTLLKLIEDIFGKENISSRTLHDLCENRFATADLKDKFVNISYELRSSDIKNFEKIKALVSGDTITTERKFENSFSFRNYAKLIFATNVMPRISEDTDAVYRRMVIIDFHARFEGEKRDPFMLEKLKEEKEGILRLLLNRIDKVIKNGVKYENDIEKIREKYNLYAYSHEMFIDEYVEPSINTCVFAKDMYEAYLDFCKENKLATKISRDGLIKELRRIQRENGNLNYTKIRVRPKGIDTEKYNGREYMLFGIRLTGKYEDMNKSTEVYTVK